MKKFCTITVLFTALVAQAQIPQSTSPYEVVERGDHHRVWQCVATETDAKGNIHYRTNSYHELETGMHFLKDGEWLESREEIEIVAEGAVARHGRHQVIFSANCNSPVAIDMLTPDGKRLQSRVLGLAYFDSASGKMVWIAELKDSVGQLLPPNQVIYIDAFTGLKAHLRYTYTKGGFEQDVILRERPAAPGKFSMNPATTRLQVMTEFLNPPTPKVEARQVDGVMDEQLDFGDMAMGSGKAFSLLGDGQDSIPVTKGWGTLDGRVFLVEEASYPLLEPLLRTLPSPQASLKTSPEGKLYAVSTQRQLPPVPATSKKSTKPMMVASVPLSGKGVVLDYTTTSSATNYTFKADTTYYVSGTVNLSGTNTIFEGGSVIKYSPTNTPKLNITSPINWQGAAYRPVVMTGRDDASVGEAIGSASLSGYYANPALYIDATAGGTSAILQYLRIAYASTAIAINGGSSNVISHAQLVNCGRGFAPTNAQFNVRNALLYNVQTNFNGSSSTGRCEHLTVNIANWLNHNSSITLTATNSLLVSVTNTGTYTGSYVSNAAPSIFKTVGAGAHYLTNDTFRNLGTTNINASLAADLKKLTTYPPVELTSNFTVDTTLSPQAQRDWDTPDLGWHYAALDYGWAGLIATNAALQLTNGVVVGTLPGASVNSAMLYVRLNGKFLTEGSATQPNILTRYNTVQEKAVTNLINNVTCVNVDPLAAAEIRCRFTDWYALSGGADHMIAYNNTIRLTDCRFSASQIFLKGCAVGLTNCLFDRATADLKDDGIVVDRYLYNNLWRGGKLWLVRDGAGVSLVRDNLFDQTTHTQSGTITHDHNGYISGYNRLTPTNATDVVLTNLPIYQTNYLGSHFYPTDDGMLSLLINAGSRTPAQAGLYHYTVKTTANSKEGTDPVQTVDIGFHYVAVNSSGLPIDTDSDGASDYWEDRNGNGSVDAGETDWTTYNSPNGLSGGGGLQVFTPLK